MKHRGELILPLDGMLVHHRVPSMKHRGELILPLDGMLVHHRVPSMKHRGVLILTLDGMLVHHRVPSMKRQGALLTPPGWSVSPGIPGWRETKRKNVACPRIHTPPQLHSSTSRLIYLLSVHRNKFLSTAHQVQQRTVPGKMVCIVIYREPLAI